MYSNLYAEVNSQRRWWGSAFKSSRENTHTFKQKLRETMANILVDKAGRRKYAIAGAMQKSAQVATATDPDEMARQMLDISSKVIAETLEQSLRAFYKLSFQDKSNVNKAVDAGVDVSFSEIKGKASIAPKQRKEAQKILSSAIQRNAARLRGVEIGAGRAAGAAASAGTSVAVAVGSAVIREALPIASPAPAPRPKQPGF